MIKRLWRTITSYFTSIDYRTLGKSFMEVWWLTLIAIAPLFVNTVFMAIPTEDFWGAVRHKAVPGEILSYSLSFLAPSLYLFIKTQGTSYRLPLLHLFSITVFFAYLTSFGIYLVAKNKWVKEIDFESHRLDFYLSLALILLSIAFACRVYTVYHGKNMVHWSETRKVQQQNFNNDFRTRINQGQ